MTARFPGRFSVVNGCLAFSSGQRLYLPVFTPGTDVRISGGQIIIGTRSFGGSDSVTVIGGELDKAYRSLLLRPNPAACEWPLLRTSGVQPGG